MSIDPETKQPRENEKLSEAILFEDYKKVARIIKNDGLPGYLVFHLRYTPLHEAATRVNHQIVALLLENGADPTIQNYWGDTPLHSLADSSAVLRENKKKSALFIMKALCEAGCPLDAKNKRSTTALQILAKNGLYDLAAELVKLGASTKGVNTRTTSNVFNQVVRQKQQEKSVQAAVRFTRRRRARQKGPSK